MRPHRPIRILTKLSTLSQKKLYKVARLVPLLLKVKVDKHEGLAPEPVVSLPAVGKGFSN